MKAPVLICYGLQKVELVQSWPQSRLMNHELKQTARSHHLENSFNQSKDLLCYTIRSRCTGFGTFG